MRVRNVGLSVFVLAISLASQHAVKDVINGFLILWEDQYAVGDFIFLGTLGGKVENMNLRITQLRNEEGRLISIPNGTISVVENLSKDWSQVNFTIDVAYDTPLKLALAVIEQVVEQMYSERQWKKQILETPEVLGIDQISHTGILIRVCIKTKPLEQSKVAREFRLRLKLAFDQHGIRVGIPQQILWQRPIEVLKETDSKVEQKENTSL
ncbi:MAG: mechanosensitive ion channel family protein [Symploca sp. SIO2B6]|nr:mechanosensitive ion channel family protein [Symploca sp. SIO2B6]